MAPIDLFEGLDLTKIVSHFKLKFWQILAVFGHVKPRIERIERSRLEGGPEGHPTVLVPGCKRAGDGGVRIHPFNSTITP